MYIYSRTCSAFCLSHCNTCICHGFFIVTVQIRRKPSYLDVKIKPKNENGTPSIVSPPRPHSPANSLPYVNVTDDRSSNQLSDYKWYVVMALSLEICCCSVMNHWLKPFIDNAYRVLLL